ncbi:hypothetical protein EJE23_19300 [Enterobacter chengduensis]|nr:hypothetical protein FY206_23605 [Enterobacter chengduensis]RSK53143.1 hypothetical protein EJE23_19300 [Enterobacter chengduensis]
MFQTGRSRQLRFAETALEKQR